ncbi:hypothetical protein NXS19_011800 [Fusarium pseudograminearum]|nr:hypothetical protein NXS19_011800 [Fusarium pseudograminearum]
MHSSEANLGAKDVGYETVRQLWWGGEIRTTTTTQAWSDRSKARRKSGTQLYQTLDQFLWKCFFLMHSQQTLHNNIYPHETPIIITVVMLEACTVMQALYQLCNTVL